MPSTIAAERRHLQTIRPYTMEPTSCGQLLRRYLCWTATTFAIIWRSRTTYAWNDRTFRIGSQTATAHDRCLPGARSGRRPFPPAATGAAEHLFGAGASAGMPWSGWMMCCSQDHSGLYRDAVSRRAGVSLFFAACAPGITRMLIRRYYFGRPRREAERHPRPPHHESWLTGNCWKAEVLWSRPWKIMCEFQLFLTDQRHLLRRRREIGEVRGVPVRTAPCTGRVNDVASRIPRPICRELSAVGGCQHPSPGNECESRHGRRRSAP